jgi:hypothetical protein
MAGILKKIVKGIAIVIAVVLAIAALVVFVPAIIAFFTTVLPVIIAQLQALAVFVYTKLAQAFPLLDKAVKGLQNVYDRWVKPTLEKVEGAITSITDSFEKVYHMTVGGIVDVYNNLFGWVDDLRVKVNGMLDKATGIAAVFDEKLAGRIQAVKQDFNSFLDKAFVDWFDRAMKKIYEVTGPIMTKVGELSAVFTERIDYVKNIVEKADRIISSAFITPTRLSDETVLDTTTTEAHTYQRKSAGGEGIYTPEPIVEQIKKTIEDKWFDDILRVIKQEKPSRYDMIKKGIQHCLNLITGQTEVWEYYVDDEVKAFEGDITAGDLDVVSHYAELYNAADEPQPTWKDKLKMWLDFRQKRKLELDSMISNNQNMIQPYLNGEISEVELIRYLKSRGYKKSTIEDLMDQIGWSGSVGKIE